MAIERAQLRWNGWGFLNRSMDLTPGQERQLLAALTARLGSLGTPSRAVGLAAARLPACRLSEDARVALREAADGALCEDDDERALHAAGKSLPDLLRTRGGELERAPDAVVYPRTPGAVARVLAAAKAHRVAVVPFGGGTSVVGGVEPVHGPDQHAVVALDTTRLDRLLGVDEVGMTATFEAGIDGPSLEASLQERGYTLGHFPQSFEHSTLGGWIAARSSGQQSDGYGGIDKLLVAARVVTPEGELRTLGVPRSAAGPDLRELVLGSEGLFGVIVEATVRVARLKGVQDIRGALFPSFERGTAAIRDVINAGLPVTMMRLSDAPETELSLLLRRDPDKRLDAASLVMGALPVVGYGHERCAMLYGVEGDDAAEVARHMRAAKRLLRAQGGLPLGKSPGRRWRAERFRTPYLRDWLLDHGVAIDTMETAFTWRELDAGHARVLAAMRSTTARNAGGGVAMGHVSHSYRDGACVYFIVLYPLALDRAVDQWRAIKTDITDAIVQAGGTLSHHHGVGLDHAPWVEREKGRVGLEALRAVKARLDPQGIMNPGKWL